jgi:hypothetical protein
MKLINIEIIKKKYRNENIKIKKGEKKKRSKCINNIKQIKNKYSN